MRRVRRRVSVARMSTRLTYTSGALGEETDREFEAELARRARKRPRSAAARDRRRGAGRGRAVRPARPVARRRRGQPRPRGHPGDRGPRRGRGPRGGGRLARDALRRTLRADARRGERHRGAPPRACGGGEPRDRQDANRVDPRGPGGGRPDHHLRGPDGGKRRLPASARQLRGQRAQRRRPASLRRVRRRLAVQLPRRARREHVRRRADRRQHGGAQALRGDAVDRRHPRRDRGRRGTCRPVSSTWSTAARRRGARSWKGRSTAWPSPARPRWGARSRARSRTVPMPGPRSPRWEARTRPSSPRRPISTPRRRAWRARPTGSRGRSAAPARARSSSTRSTTSSWPRS